MALLYRAALTCLVVSFLTACQSGQENSALQKNLRAHEKKLASSAQAASPSSLAHVKFGVQLWSVKDVLNADFDGTLQQIAGMGFEGVEFAGEFGPYAERPAALKARLATLNLHVTAAHVGFDALVEPRFDKTIAFYKALGVNTLIIPWDDRAWSEVDVDSLIKDLNRLSVRLDEKGFRLGYHNHDQEFNPFNGQTFWDYIAQNSRPEMLLQLDVGWANYAGLDPVAVFQRYATRTLTMHFKVRTHNGGPKRLPHSPILGENASDVFKWSQLLQACAGEPSLEWIIVEQEEYPEGMSSLQAVEKSWQGLREIFDGL